MACRLREGRVATASESLSECRDAIARANIQNIRARIDLAR